MLHPPIPARNKGSALSLAAIRSLRGLRATSVTTRTDRASSPWSKLRSDAPGLLESLARRLAGCERRAGRPALAWELNEHQQESD